MFRALLALLALTAVLCFNESVLTKVVQRVKNTVGVYKPCHYDRTQGCLSVGTNN